MFLKTLVISALLCTSTPVFCGAQLVGSYAGGEGSSYTSPGTPAPAVLDTLKIKVGSLSNPNTNSGPSVHGVDALYDDSWYDVVTAADDGSAMRYGGVSSSARTVPSYNVNGVTAGRADETDHGGAPPVFMSYVAFNIGAVPPGYLIEKAHAFFSPMRLTSPNLTTGFFAFRADTIPADYDMLNSVSSAISGDLNWLDTSWNEVDIDASQAWVPALDDRDDWADFGPRCDAVYAPPASIDQDTAVRLTVTDPVQQNRDVDNTGDWIIFVMYGVGTPTITTAWAASDNVGKAAHGAPALSIVATPFRGVRPWQGAIPVTFVWDDSKPADPDIFALLDSIGVEFTAAIYANGWDATSDSLWAANNGVGFGLLPHTKTHLRLGTLTPGELNFELSRDWIGAPEFSSPLPDTLKLNDGVWVGGDPFEERYSFDAIQALFDNNYRTARATTSTWHTEIGELTYPAWDMYVNLYAVQSALGGVVFGGTTFAELEDNFWDYVDLCYTENHRSAVMIYNHGFSNGATIAEIRRVFEIIDASSVLRYQTHGWVMDQLTFRPFVDAADVTEVDGATKSIATSAAMHDSTGASWINSVWVGPR